MDSYKIDNYAKEYPGRAFPAASFGASSQIRRVRHASAPTMLMLRSAEQPYAVDVFEDGLRISWGGAGEDTSLVNGGCLR